MLQLPVAAWAQFTYTAVNGAVTITGYTGAGGSVSIPDTINGLPVARIGTFAFNNFTTITSVTIGNNVTEIETFAFNNCTGLRSVTMGENVVVIGSYAFDNCTGLASITMGNRVSSVGTFAFDNCTDLSKVTMGNSVISVGDYAFDNCTGLTTVMIGNGLAKLGSYVFDNCINLKGAYFSGNAPSTGLFVFDNATSATVYYVAGTVGWGTMFAGRPTAVWDQQSQTNPPVQTKYSPVGTWEVTVGGQDKGIAFLTFYDDFSMSGYGMTIRSFGMFTIEGTWTLDAKNNLLVSYTETLNDQVYAGNIKGKAAIGKRLQGKATASNGSFSLSGVPYIMTPNLSGAWVAKVTQLRTTTLESIALTSSAGTPGVFDLSGSATGPSGYFTISGQAILTSRGKVVVYSESDFASGGTALGSWTGSFNLGSQTGSLTGVTDSGVKAVARLSR